ncbi:signal peptidase II [Actinopolymorpha pittospori]
MQTEGRASLNDATEADDSRRRRQLGLFAAVAIVVLAIDVTTKIAAMAYLSDRDPVPLAGGLLTLRLIRNSGAAFSLAEGYTLGLSIVALGLVIVVLRLSRKLRSTPWAIALGLLLGGALGNLSDRIFREPGFLRGHVVDFLELPNWPVFNVADMSVCAAAALIILMALRGRRWDGTIEGSSRTPKETSTSQDDHDGSAREATRGAPESTDGRSVGTSE